VGDPLNATKIDPYRIVLSTDKLDLGQTKIPYNFSELNTGIITALVRNDSGLACQKTGQICPLNIEIST
jgi:hypothetical protein